jgi:hypothetical protein
MDKSALGPSGRMSVAELFARLGSVIPLGAATVAVLDNVPKAVLEMVAVTVKVADPPESRFTSALISPPPLVVPQLDPAEAVQVQIAFDKTEGRLSVTVASVTALGPSLVTIMVKVVCEPGAGEAVGLVLLILKSAVGIKVSVSVAELLVLFGSVMPFGGAAVAVFTSVPVAVLETLAVKLNVAAPPDNRLTVALIFPPPLAAPQLDPAVAVQVQIAFVRMTGKLSVTVAAVTALGPSLVTTRV